MTELKTLKDLEFELVGMKQLLEKAYYQKSFLGAARFVDPEELKQEAIKWVEHLSVPFTDHTYDDEEVVKWIKEFFNITEEELKND